MLFVLRKGLGFFFWEGLGFRLLLLGGLGFGVRFAIVVMAAIAVVVILVIMIMMMRMIIC